MKTLKLALALAATLVTAQAASAQTVHVRIVGSSAYRAAVLTAASQIYSSPPAEVYVGAMGSDPTKATYAIFSGTVSGVAGTVIIKTAFSGSVGGTQTVFRGLAVGSQFLPSNGFLADSVVASASAGTVTPTSSPTYETDQVADVAFSDVFSGNTNFQNTVPRVTAANPRGAIVGVVPFVFVLKANATTFPITNITSNQVRNLLAGVLDLSSFGVANTTPVSAVGRDNDSGTRVSALADSQYGINTQAAQFQPVDASGAAVTLNSQTIANYVPYPAENLFQLGSTTVRTRSGDAGYSSGSTLAAALSAPNTSGTWFGSYLGVNDAKTATSSSAPAPAVALTLNNKSLPISGTAADQAAAINGGYIFWGYEHLYVAEDLETRGTPDAATVVRALGRQVRDVTASVSGVPAASLTVRRATDGAPVDFTSGALPAESRPFNLDQ